MFNKSSLSLVSKPDLDDGDNKDFYLTLMRAYINSANDGIFVVCDEMKFHVANKLLESWFGETESSLTEHNKRIPITHFLGVEESQQLFLNEFEKVIAGQAVRFECEIHPPKGVSRWVEISLNRVDLDGGDLVIGVVRDNSEKKAAMADILRQSSHDELTGLVNRREFNKRLDALLDTAKTQGTQHALLYMDLDQFKVVNDTCGHIAGDELLRQLSELVKSKVRNNDTLARLGGDEFGVLLVGCSEERAMEIAEVLRATISSFHFVWQGKRFEIGVSIGAIAITGNKTATELLSSADAACYVAKDQGRNRIQLYFGGETCTGKRREMDWVSRISLAFEENRFRLYYQDIQAISVQDNAQDHKEILLRMIDESGNVVGPEEFMPAAEKYGLMPSIDRWVVRTLFARESNRNRERRKHSASGELDGDALFSINLSGASLNDKAFLEFLRNQITLHDVSAHAICFEITETVAVNNFKQISDFIRDLKELGFRFALDDFGSGMSSFTYLKLLPVNYLKIDGAMVKEMSNSKIDFCMVESIQRIAHEMNIKTIAEYVENDAILEKLKKVGVNYAQGYAVHKPEVLKIN